MQINVGELPVGLWESPRMTEHEGHSQDAVAFRRPIKSTEG